MFVLLVVRKYVSNIRRELTRSRNKSRQQTSIYTDIRNNSLTYTYDDCDNTTAAIERMNKANTNNNYRMNDNPEYIELGDNRREPVYTPILPPIFQ